MVAGAVTHQWDICLVRRNMPDPIPIMVLGRLAVDSRAQGIKLGAAMLQDAPIALMPKVAASSTG